MTVDWTNWLTMTLAEQAALWRRYKEIIKAESDESRRTNYAAMNAAIFGRGK